MLRAYPIGRLPIAASPGYFRLLLMNPILQDRDELVEALKTIENEYAELGAAIRPSDSFDLKAALQSCLAALNRLIAALLRRAQTPHFFTALVLIEYRWFLYHGSRLPRTSGLAISAMILGMSGRMEFVVPVA